MKKCVFILLILLLPIKGYTQGDEFVVLTFSVKNPNDKVTWEYFWITPFDSISEERSTPLCLIPFAANDRWEGSMGKWQEFPLDSFKWYFTTTQGNLTPPQRLIVKNRKLIQTIKRKWELSGLSLEVKVYATPIKGNIHICRQKYLEMEYSKAYYLYYTEEPIEFWPGFWKTDEAKEIAGMDYGYFMYDMDIDYVNIRKAKQK